MKWTKQEKPVSRVSGDTWELVQDGLYAQVSVNGTWMLGEDELVVGKDAKILDCGVAHNLEDAKATVETLLVLKRMQK